MHQLFSWIVLKHGQFSEFRVLPVAVPKVNQFMNQLK